MSAIFLRPRLFGGRFDNHRIPLELLKDFAAFEEMVVSFAKWKYLQEHPERERVPRGFANSIELALVGVEKGSAIPIILMTIALESQVTNARYFENARDEIIHAIASIHQGGQPEIPPNLLSFFDRFGRSLRQDEGIELTRADGVQVVFNQAVRHELLRASQIEDWSEEMTVRGRVSEVDQGRAGFELELRGGLRISAPLTLQHSDIVLQALSEYRTGTVVALQGVVMRNRANRLVRVESIEDVTILDPLDVALRLEELSDLKDGWLDGRGFAPSWAGLQWLVYAFEKNYDISLPLPYLYPTPEGGIRAEWSLNDQEISLEIDLETRKGAFHALSLQDEIGRAHV